MDTTRRSFLAGSLGALAVGLAACSSSKSSSAGSSGATSGPASSGVPTSGGASTVSATVTGNLLVWDFGTSALAKVDDANFAKLYPGVKVTHVAQPANNYTTLVQSALAAGKGPDVFTLHTGTELNTFIPALVNISDRLTADQKKYVLDYSGVSLNGDPSQGVYGLPYQMNGLQFFYNKALFRKAGLDPAAPPSSWDEFMTVCGKLKAAGITPISAGNAEGLQASEYWGVLAPSELTIAETLALSSGAMKYNSPKVKDAFERYVAIAKAGYFETSWLSDGFFTQQVDLFSSGKAAMTMTLSNYVGVFSTALKGDLGVFVNPGLTAGTKSNYVPYAPGLGFCISKRSGNQDAAYAWATYKTSMANQQADLDALSTADTLQNGALPTDIRVKPAANALPSVTALVQMLQTNKTHLPPSSKNPAVATALLQEGGSIVNGSKSIDTLLNDLDKAQSS